MDLQQELLGQSKVIIVSPAPMFGVKLIEAVQRTATLIGGSLLVDAENWMAHPGAANQRPGNLRTMRWVILPQALRTMLPSLVNQFVSTVKETSLGYIIGLAEISFIASQINSQVFTMPTQVYLILGLTYFLLCFGLSRFAFWLERRQARRVSITDNSRVAP